MLSRDMQAVLTRLPPDALARVDQLATLDGMSRSTWLRQAVLTALRDADGRCVTCGQASTQATP